MQNSKIGTKFAELDNNTFKILLDNKYLKREIFPPIEGKCKYLIKDHGAVYCEYHGSVEYRNNEQVFRHLKNV